MSMAPPGVESGRYHIILGYIPRKRTWQDLKDFLQQAGFKVVHVQVHAGLHCGWISVDAADTFWQLGKWLQDVEWGGNRFQVDLRNYDQPCSLGPSQYIPPRPSSSSQATQASQSQQQQKRQIPTRIPPQSTSPALAYSYAPVLNNLEALSPQTYNYPVASYSSISPAQPYTYGSATAINYGPAYAPVPSPTHATPSNYPPIPTTHQRQVISYGHAPLASQPTANQPLSQPTFQQPQIGYPSFTSHRLQASASPSAAIRLERRRLHLSRIPGCSTSPEIRALVLAAAGSSPITSATTSSTDPSAIVEEIDMPRHPDGSFKGHALVLLGSEEIAERVRRSLDGRRIAAGKDAKGKGVGNLLKVKLAQEGALPRGVAGEIAKGRSPVVAAERMAIVMEEITEGLGGMELRGGGSGNTTSAATFEEPTMTGNTSFTMGSHTPHAHSDNRPLQQKPQRDAERHQQPQEKGKERRRSSHSLPIANGATTTLVTRPPGGSAITTSPYIQTETTSSKERGNATASGGGKSSDKDKKFGTSSGKGGSGERKGRR